MIGRWARRAADLHGELREIAELGRDPRWWLLAGGAALACGAPAAYIMSDAEPSADTFIGHVAAAPRDPFADAVVRAVAARDAIRALDGRLPGQPLAVTIRRMAGGAVVEPSRLDEVAFAIGEGTWTAAVPSPSNAVALAELAAELARVAAGAASRVLRPLGDATSRGGDAASRGGDAASRGGDATAPFLCVTLGEEPLATARHGHRRAWRGNGTGCGPWLGLSRAGGLAIASTCHMAVDGYGHAWLAEAIRDRAAAIARDVRFPDVGTSLGARPALPSPAVPVAAPPLAVAWRPITAPIPSALQLAYALGRLLHRIAGQPDAPFSPTFQIPVAPGAPDDPERRRRRVVPAIASVRFDGGEPEPFAAFATRTRALLRREADGAGPSARLLTAAQAVPAPLAWKRRAVGAHRPRWLDAVATLVGGRGCISRIRLDAADHPATPACAVSSPGRVPTATDPLGGCVVTVVDDGRTGGITLCGAGRAGEPAESLLDELLAMAR